MCVKALPCSFVSNHTSSERWQPYARWNTCCFITGGCSFSTKLVEVFLANCHLLKPPFRILSFSNLFNFHLPPCCTKENHIWKCDLVLIHCSVSLFTWYLFVCFGNREWLSEDEQLHPQTTLCFSRCFLPHSIGTTYLNPFPISLLSTDSEIIISFSLWPHSHVVTVS